MVIAEGEWGNWGLFGASHYKQWRQIVEKDCRARGLNREDAMDRARWRKLIGMIDDYECSSRTGSPGFSRTNSTEP